MKKAFLFLLIAGLALSFCSKKKEDAAPAGSKFHEANEPRATQAAAAEAPPQIKAVALSPEAPTVLDNVTAVAELQDPDRVYVNFQYQWFVNGEENMNAAGDKLEKGNFKKGAWIYCRVRTVSGAGESEWAKSEVVRVLNSLPTLQLGPVGDFNVPGDIHYQAAASDPDDDVLTFELLSPLDQGIALDAGSGALSWSLSEDIVKRLGEKIEIKLAVSDGEGEKVTGTITLQFTSTKK